MSVGLFQHMFFFLLIFGIRTTIYTLHEVDMSLIFRFFFYKFVFIFVNGEQLCNGLRRFTGSLGFIAGNYVAVVIP